ncbi:aminoglycoside phosphotransferase family protein [Umezawaea endophytica]|uniref:Aminoglycoside phosphotransferase family protein n=1 Tax=Umezawaea endophytica TaxID=1654476 RepID=A0A9X3AG75_9PSEU|nr:aminoglycoside phosphotransferase family protein [Umezawaea endophytica]MCS7479747.1 aminoglycoside phosphotransferase family protein [Umezawaea endophytica]
MITVPKGFGEGLGKDAPEWVDSLPKLAAEFCARWRLTPDGDLLNGYVAVVLPVRRADGTPAALKLTWQDTETEHEALALKLWDGRGVVRLLDHDDEHGALLLERLDHTRTLMTAPIEVAVQVTGELLRDLRVPAPPEVDQVGFRDFAADNAAHGHPVPKPLLDQAVSLVAELTADAGRTLVNGDLHYGNVLGGDRAPWLMIDPKPLAGDPEFCALPLLWNRFTEMDGRRGTRDRLRALADIGELDFDRARAWGVVRAVEGELWALRVGDTDFADVAEALAERLG